jgi:dihydroflavonol-4-reductase
MDGGRGRACLVTGATGLVGNNVVRLLVDAGFTVRVLVRPGTAAAGRPLGGLPVERVESRLDDDAGLARAVDGMDVVVHAAARMHVGQRHLGAMREANVDGTRRVARAACRAGARLVHVSSVDALGVRPDGAPADEDTPPDGLPGCPFVITTREAETEVLRAVDRGLDAVIVNPVFMLGPWDWKPSSGRMLLEVAAGRGVFAPPGSNDFVDARDVAAGIRAALDRGTSGRRYILGGHRLTYREAWTIFARVTGRRPPLATAPEALVRAAGWCGDVAGLFQRHEAALNSAAARMALVARSFSFRRAERELGYAIRPLEQTVRDAWRWFVTRGYAAPIRRRAA